MKSTSDNLPFVPPSSTPGRALWRRFWRHSFLARVFLLSLSGGADGLFVGALIGWTNSIDSGPFHSWWYWVGFTAPASGVWMLFFSFPVALVVFTTVGIASRRWSLSRKRRFARGLKTRLFLPVIGSLIATSLLALLAWVVRHRGLSSTPSDVGTVLMNTQIATVAFASCLFAALLAHFSKHPRRKKQAQSERILPLD